MKWEKTKSMITWFEANEGPIRLVIALDAAKRTCMYISKRIVGAEYARQLFREVWDNGHKEKEAKVYLEEKYNEIPESEKAIETKITGKNQEESVIRTTVENKPRFNRPTSNQAKPRTIPTIAGGRETGLSFYRRNRRMF